MKKRDIKENLLEHSEAKVKLLSEYIKRYLNVISHDQYTQGIKIYDVFCGLGVYENGGEGSPLIIMRAIKGLFDWNTVKGHKTPKIDFYFNDINEQRVANVQKAIVDRDLCPKELCNLRSSSKNYKDILEIIRAEISKLKNEKAFVFIDPYGYKDIKAQDIKTILKSGKAEVLLFSPIQFMYRFNENGTPPALQEFVNELKQGYEWQNVESVAEYIIQLRDALIQYLGPEYYVDTFKIKKDSQTTFCLFFFSSHIRGFEKMLEAKWEIDTEAGMGWTPLGTGLFAAIKTNPLEEKLRTFLSSEKRFNGDVYKYTLQQGFLPTHATQVLTNWQDNGQIIVIGKDNKPAKKGAFYISYDNYQNDYKKVSYKI